MKKIGILGSGVVAQTLGAGFAKYGYDVMLGTRTASELEEWKSNTEGNISIGTFAETAAFGDVVLLAVKGTVAKDALAQAGGENLKGKIVMDATNPISDSAPVNGVLNFFTSLESSLMEQLQAEHPEAKFVKVFSSVGSHFMVNPTFESKPSMFICGNDEEAKKEVSVIVDQFGWETEDMGNIEAARAIEPLCMLWCIPGFRSNQWNHAFKLLRA